MLYMSWNIKHGFNLFCNVEENFATHNSKGCLRAGKLRIRDVETRVFCFLCRQVFMGWMNHINIGRSWLGFGWVKNMGFVSNTQTMVKRVFLGFVLVRTLGLGESSLDSPCRILKYWISWSWVEIQENGRMKWE